MSEIKVERVAMRSYLLFSTTDGVARAYLYPDGMHQVYTSPSQGSTAAEARAFAAAIIAVADAVEREGKG